MDDEGRSEEERGEAARRIVALSPETAAGPIALLERIHPRTPPGLATALVTAAGESRAAGVGLAMVETLERMTPGMRGAALGRLLSRPDWTGALLDGVEAGSIRLTELDLDQKQALAAHPDAGIAERAKRMMASGGGLPDADRQKVIEELSAQVLQGGDVGRGKVAFEQQCAKCHSHGGTGGKVGPDLTGMAAHPAGGVAGAHPGPEPVGGGELRGLYGGDRRWAGSERVAGGGVKDGDRAGGRGGETRGCCGMRSRNWRRRGSR